MKRLTTAIAITALAVALWPTYTLAGPTVDSIKKRGKVICGVNGNRAGFSALDSKGQWQGMDVDTCKAVAAAILGDKNKVQFVKTTTQTRFTALQTGEVDVLTRNVTWTLSRDSKLGIDFVAPTFYDGQGFMVNKSLGVKSVKDLGGATVCVLPGTSSEKVAEDVFKKNGLKYTAVVIESKKELNTAFFGGRCDVHVQSTSGLSSARATVASNPDDYIILPGIVGKDPMGPVVRQGDDQWFSIVKWVHFAMLNAEEMGVTSANVDEMVNSTDPNVMRLLGKEGAFGEAIGVSNDWAYNVIKQVGNYGEVFERNVGASTPLGIARGVNALWSKGGLQYAPPIR